jgi:hypothetical protein
VAIHGNRVVALGQQTTASGTMPLAELSADGGPESAEGQELPAVAQPGMETLTLSWSGWISNRGNSCLAGIDRELVISCAISLWECPYCTDRASAMGSDLVFRSCAA